MFCPGPSVPLYFRHLLMKFALVVGPLDPSEEERPDASSPLQLTVELAASWKAAAMCGRRRCSIVPTSLPQSRPKPPNSLPLTTPAPSICGSPALFIHFLCFFRSQDAWLTSTRDSPPPVVEIRLWQILRRGRSDHKSLLTS